MDTAGAVLLIRNGTQGAIGLHASIIKRCLLPVSAMILDSF